ncbi:MAG: response regulator [Deltaproteobacteria bacterium]|nr:response regulator [Deltaproteobacteria bacterium]
MREPNGEEKCPERRKHILLVDDEPDFLYSATVALRGAGYDVTVAGSGADALKMMIDAHNGGRRYSLLLTDIVMPGMSGLDLIAEMKRREIEIPVLVVTGVSDTVLISEFGNDGCMGYIQKPFQPPDLIGLVGRFLQQTEKEVEL